MEGPIRVSTDKLLFWPNNPRLKISDFSEVHFTRSELLDLENQEKIFNLLSSTEQHDVQTLVQSMRHSGFMQERAPIVMRIDRSDQYLVLEGNRRLASIKTILRDRSTPLADGVRTSLQEIPCWLFVHTSQQVPLEAAISRMVAEAHIKGQKPHTKLQQAHMLYNAYEGFLLEELDDDDFKRVPHLLVRAADFFGLTVREFELEVAIVRFYKQLIAAGYHVPHAAREKLSWIYQYPGQFQTFFGYDSSDFSLDADGLARFHDLFISDTAAITNPALFRKFQNVMKHGRMSDVEAIRCEPDQLDPIVRRIKEDNADSEFLNGIQSVEKRIKSLRVSAFKETKEEVSAVTRVVDLVENRLARLIRPAMGGMQEAAAAGTFRTPSVVEEAMSTAEPHLKDQILRVVRARPNQTCIREKVPTLLLKHWGVKSRGKPRERFCERIEPIIEQMEQEGLIEVYRAKNERIRVR